MGWNEAELSPVVRWLVLFFPHLPEVRLFTLMIYSLMIA